MESVVRTTAQDREILLRESMARLRPQVLNKANSTSVIDRINRFASYEQIKQSVVEKI